MTVTAFRDGRVTLRSNRRTDGFTESVKDIGYQGVRPGEVVIHSMDAFAGAIGVSDSSGKMSPVVHIYTTPGDNPEFVVQALRTASRAGYIRALAKGIRERSTSFDRPVFKSMLLPRPPRGEQDEIVAYLDRETQRIDELIAEQRGLIETLRERRQAVVGSEFDKLGSANSRLKYHSVIQTGVTLNGEGAEGLPEYPYLRVANVQVGHVATDDLKSIRVTQRAAETSLLHTGDVLMTEGGDIDKLGRGAVWEGEISPIIHQNHIFAVRPTDSLNSHYLAYWLDCTRARRYFFVTAKKTTNLASTNKWVIGNLPVPWATKQEQRHLVSKLDDQTSRIDALIAESEDLIALSQERRAALITAAVTGQIDVRTAA